MNRPTVGDILPRKPKVKKTSLAYVLKLSGKRTTGVEASGGTSIGEAPKGQSCGDNSDNLSGKKAEAQFI